MHLAVVGTSDAGLTERNQALSGHQLLEAGVQRVAELLRELQEQLAELVLDSGGDSVSRTHGRGVQATVDLSKAQSERGLMQRVVLRYDMLDQTADLRIALGEGLVRCDVRLAQ